MRSYHLFCLFVIPCFLSCQQAQEQGLFNFTSIAVTGQGTCKAVPETANIIFQSADGGQTWQDISAGLPEGLKAWSFFADKGELILTTEKGIYKNSTFSKSALWEKDIAMSQQLINVSACASGLMAVSNNGRFFQRLKGTDIWMPIFTDYKSSMVRTVSTAKESQDSVRTGFSMGRTVFTAKDGSIFIGSDDGIFKSADGGKTWKHVMQDGWMIDMVESDGVLLCTNQGGILRSTDGGEHWDVVVSEGGVGIAVEAIKGGFAAITYNTESETRRIRTSTDGGKTWQPIDAGLPPSKLISSIKQVGETFYCGHPKGIYRSDDRGKSWELLLPTIGEKVFNLSVSGDVIYAVLREGGC